ncbi:MAG TPA: HlyD family efflux transporter periplasmic adaptor subunit [Gemmatimonadaceae bacterium]|nr:HlyD family efflux transporter periplasmic adaptor subunit [Gemmatimonadaceae bacterium]
MAFLRSRWFIASAVVVLLGVPATWLFAHHEGASDPTLDTTVKHGDFRVLVTTSGELRARKFVQISAPQGAMQAQIYQMKIASLVPEGTLVKAGDVVATLDRASVAPKLADVTLAVQKAQAAYEQAMLDSTLTLSKAREDIRSQELALEQKKIVKEQSIYEAPSIQRQAEIDYEQGDRALAEAKANYKTQTLQAQAKMSEVGADLGRQKNQLAMVQSVMAGFTIRAPSPGMVIYVKEWDGKKRTVGSAINAFDAAVATLPDLTQMESVTYINEIDVRKVAVGQPVTISLDADPSKTLAGTVASVANVGEQRPNSDAKVFEVHINVDRADTTLRPGMTTGNAILTYEARNATYVPIEAVSSDAGIPIVYRRAGSDLVMQEVQTGAMNDDDVIIARGLKTGDDVLLAPPTGKGHLTLVRLPGSRRPVAPLGDTALPEKPAAAAAGGPRPRPRD